MSPTTLDRIPEMPQFPLAQTLQQTLGFIEQSVSGGGQVGTLFGGTTFRKQLTQQAGKSGLVAACHLMVAGGRWCRAKVEGIGSNSLEQTIDECTLL